RPRVVRPTARTSFRLERDTGYTTARRGNRQHIARRRARGGSDAGMDLELKGKVAIVGGASKGLGRACAEVLAEEGAKVAMCSRTQADLVRTAKEIREATGTDVLALAGDLDNHQTIRDLIAAATSRFGRLDILVNNSGGPPL